MRHLTPASPATAVIYSSIYLSGGFGGAGNPGDVFLDLKAPTKIEFGSTEHSGGFIKPDIRLAALSRVIGLAGDSATVAANSFDPAKFLQGALPKLFGLFDLIDVLDSGRPRSQQGTELYHGDPQSHRRPSRRSDEARRRARRCRDNHQRDGGGAIQQSEVASFRRAAETQERARRSAGPRTAPARSPMSRPRSRRRSTCWRRRQLH